MKALYKITLASFAIGLYVGCSPVSFSVDEARCEKVGQNCIVQDGYYHFDNSVSAGGGKVDILIVDDNSASMSFEQKNLASRFSGFISQLEGQNADYRIGITTTDVSSNVSDTVNNYPRSINGNGTLQDGNLIAFGSGVPYLTPKSGSSINDRVAMFNNTIVRSETQQCEQFIATWVQNKGISSTGTAEYSQQYSQNCPSGDERGIFAANLAVKKNPSGFIRQGAHLAIIFLSDEDERSGLYSNGGYALSDYDQPNTLIQNIRTNHGTDKGISVHAIVAKDSSCLAVQNNQTLGNPPVSATTGFVNGSLGSAYLTFVNTGWGKAVDICFNDYTSQLGTISTSILEKINSVAIACSNPKNLAVTISNSQNPSGVTGVTWTQEGKEIRFNQQLPTGTSVRLVYDCTSI